jgi:hypothetical protein
VTISNKSIGSLVVDQAPIKINIFENFTPFFISIDATGNAPYSGPAAAEPKNIAKRIPFNPDFSPIYFTMLSLETHTSRRPSKIKIGGITKSISFMLSNECFTAVFASV